MSIFDEKGKPIALPFRSKIPSSQNAYFYVKSKPYLLGRKSFLKKMPIFDEKGKPIALLFSCESLLLKVPIFDEIGKPIALPLRSRISSSQSVYF